jgi:hypothetical protein
MLSPNAPDLQFSLVCLGYDETKGPPTFQHVVQELALGPFPYAFPEGAGLFLVNGWNGLAEQTETRVRLLSPSGKPLLDNKISLQASVTGNCLSVIFLEGLVFAESGPFWFEIFLGSELRRRFPLLIEEVEMT